MNLAEIIVLVCAAASASALVALIRPVLEENSRTKLTFGRLAMTGGSAFALVLSGILTYGFYKAPSEAVIWDFQCRSNALQMEQLRNGLKTMCEADKDYCGDAAKQAPFDACAILFNPLW